MSPSSRLSGRQPAPTERHNATIGVVGSRVVGRDRELRLLLKWLHEVMGGHGRIALIHGEAGIGKTLMLAELTRSARGMGFAIVEGAARELQREEPFAAIAIQLCAESGD